MSAFAPPALPLPPREYDVAYFEQLNRVLTAYFRTLRFEASSGGTSPAPAGVASFNLRTGNVTLNLSDVTGALGYTPYNTSNPAGYITASALSPYALATHNHDGVYAPIGSGGGSGNSYTPSGW